VNVAEHLPGEWSIAVGDSPRPRFNFSFDNEGRWRLVRLPASLIGEVAITIVGRESSGLWHVSKQTGGRSVIHMYKLASTWGGPRYWRAVMNMLQESNGREQADFVFEVEYCTSDEIKAGVYRWIRRKGSFV
jgi:hypothetical protein